MGPPLGRNKDHGVTHEPQPSSIWNRGGRAVWSKVLVFIDGMGENLHGDPNRRQRVRILRAKACMAGFQFVEITAGALNLRTTAAWRCT